MVEKKKSPTAKKTQRTEAPSENYSQLLWSIVSLIQAQQETNKLLIDWQNKILEHISTPKQEVVVPEREPEAPVFTDEVTYQVFGEIATKFEYEMSIEIFWEYKTRAEAERMLEATKEKYLGKPYDKYATPIYFKYFNIKENVTKVING